MTAYLAVALPLAAFVLIVLFGLRGRGQRVAPGLLIAALSGSLAVSLYTLWAVYTGQLAAGTQQSFTWLAVRTVDPPLVLRFGILVDGLSALMMVVVSAVGLLVQVYSVGYMRGDDGYGRYFAFMSLFTFSMLGLVTANNLLQTYLFWELVGLCSYLLIGFWYRRPEAANAAKKAFVVTRLGDTGFLLGVLALSYSAGTLNFARLEQIVAHGALTPFFFGASAFTTVIALLIFSGAVGKSAQFPLHVWLPDAMEGPTPVSALIHAATMVAAGVYLVARTYFIFAASPYALGIVALVGAFTAFLAATIALTQHDIKRILAYSTISQLGYMMLALGASGYVAGMFHLTTHAFFKALLFLCAGSVIHAVHSNDIRDMGGLARRMPVTALTCAVGALALAGIPPLSGFFSKDEVLVAVQASAPIAHLVGAGGRTLVLGAALATVFMTACYMSRLWLVVFAGGNRSEHGHEPHESPPSMTGPLLALAALAAVAGAFNLPTLGHPLGRLLGEGEPLAAVPALAVGSVALGLAGIAVAVALYGLRLFDLSRVKAGWPLALYRGSLHNWYIDAFYTRVVARGALLAADLFAWVDRHVVNGMVDGVGWLAGRAGAALRRTETGQLQLYAYVIVSAATAVAVAFWAVQAGYLPPLLPR